MLPPVGKEGWCYRPCRSPIQKVQKARTPVALVPLSGVVVVHEEQMSAARMVPIGDGRRRRMQVGVIVEGFAHQAEVCRR